MGIRISQLSANALPYTGKELIPLVQSNTTRAGTLSSFTNYLSGIFIPTVTNYLSTNNVLLSSSEVTDNIVVGKAIIASESVIPLTVTVTNLNKTFADDDTNKVFHFDTSATVLTATFPKSLSQGFNSGIMNIGTNTLYLSTNSSLSAIDNKLVDQFTGAYVYRYDGDIYAVGGF